MDAIKPRGSRPRNAHVTDSKVRLWVEVDAEVRQRLIDLAYARRVTYSHLVRTILDVALAATASGRRREVGGRP